MINKRTKFTTRKEYGEHEVTEDEHGNQGIIIWLGTKREIRARSMANRVLARLGIGSAMDAALKYLERAIG